MTDFSEENECIIAHVPYLDDSDSENIDSPAIILRDLENTKTVSSRLRDRIIQFFKHISKDAVTQQVKIIKPTPTSNSDAVQINVKPLPIHNIDNLCFKKGISCWWCTEAVEKDPIYLPHWVTDGVFHVTGYFCSVNCALAYNLSKKDTSVSQRGNLLTLMYNKCFKDGTNPFIPAPPRELLDKFGGPMTIKNFRQNASFLQDNRLLLPPIQSIFYTIETQKRSSSSYPKGANYVPINHDHVSKAKETLKLKRNAPRKTNYVSLEETMGIIKRSVS